MLPFVSPQNTTAPVATSFLLGQDIGNGEPEGNPCSLANAGVARDGKGVPPEADAFLSRNISRFPAFLPGIRNG